MYAKLRLMLPLILPLWLNACASVPQPTGRPVVTAKRGEATTVARESIRRELARLCPAALAPTTLDWLATQIEAAPATAFGPVSDVDRLDRETRTCRGAK